MTLPGFATLQRLAGPMAICAGAMSATSAVAAPPAFGCYARTYRASELAANPGQTVASVALRFKRFRGDVGDRVDANVDVIVRFADRETVSTTAGGCGRRDGALACGFDGDMGFLTARATSAGVQIEIPDYLAFDVGADGVRRLAIEGKANRVFALPKATSKTSCEFKS